MSYIAPNLDKNNHCFFGAEGGISQGKYFSLNTNFSSQDSREAINKNFQIIADYFNSNINRMCTIRQGVSNIAIEINEPQWFQTVADGMVTREKDILLGIKTADCTPVFLADYKNEVIGVAHAGWRGAYKGIVENVLSLMLKNGANLENIAVAIGPCIQQDSFEVGDDTKAIFLNLSKDNERFFIKGQNDSHWYLDLSGYLFDKIKKLGINNVVNSKIDTYPINSGYFSFRRNTHLNLIDVKYDYPTQYSFMRL